MIVSGSMDHNILLWRSTGSCENLGLLAGHKSAVLDLQWSRDGQVVYSASADAHLMSWDVEAGVRVRKHPGHEEVINCLDVSKRGEEFLVSGSDDGFISIWDPRQKSAMDYIETNMPVTAVCLSDAGNEFFSGSIDNNIKVWDLRMKKTSYSLPGHTDTITSLALSPDSQTLLSFSHDSTVRTWDVRPFAAANRHIRIYDGAQIGLERNLVRARWDGEGKRIAVGGGDGTVTVWETTKGKMLHKLPGHKGCVNDVGISKDGSMSESVASRNDIASLLTLFSLECEYRSDNATGRIARVTKPRVDTGQLERSIMSIRWTRQMAVQGKACRRSAASLPNLHRGKSPVNARHGNAPRPPRTRPNLNAVNFVKRWRRGLCRVKTGLLCADLWPFLPPFYLEFVSARGSRWRIAQDLSEALLSMLMTFRGWNDIRRFPNRVMCTEHLVRNS